MPVSGCNALCVREACDDRPPDRGAALSIPRMCIGGEGASARGVRVLDDVKGCTARDWLEGLESSLALLAACAAGGSVSRPSRLPATTLSTTSLLRKGCVASPDAAGTTAKAVGAATVATVAAIGADAAGAGTTEQHVRWPSQPRRWANHFGPYELEKLTSSQRVSRASSWTALSTPGQ